jgi:hypothetical protein
MRGSITDFHVLAGLALAGCISVGQAGLADDATLARIKVGQTIRQEVLALLGEPSASRRTVQAGVTREWWAYEHASSTINPFDYLFLYGFWTNGVGLFDTRRDLHVFFDAEGVVKSLVLQRTSYDMGGPFRTLHVTGTAVHSLSVGGHPGGPVSFMDTMEYRY